MFIFRVLLASADQLTELEKIYSSTTAVDNGSRLVLRTKAKGVDFDAIDAEIPADESRMDGDGEKEGIGSAAAMTLKLSMSTLEERAVRGLLELLESVQQKLPTSLSEDIDELQSLRSASESSASNAKLVLALTYRVTRKRILRITIQRLQEFATHFETKINRICDLPPGDPQSKWVAELARRVWTVPVYLASRSGARDTPVESLVGFKAFHQYLTALIGISD